MTIEDIKQTIEEKIQEIELQPRSPDQWQEGYTDGQLKILEWVLENLENLD